MIRLGSNSETRALILREKGIEFIQTGCDFDEESVTETDPKKFVYAVTFGKFNDCKDKFGLDTPILVADTIVVANNKILRKAYSREEAKNILLEQSGNTVSIITAMVFQKDNFQMIDLSSTDYKFREFESSELEKYLDSNDWQGKAGACMVEGFCQSHIESFRGFTSTAMGLTVEKIVPYLN